MTLNAKVSPMLKALKLRIAEMGPHFDQVVLQVTQTLYQPLLPRASERVRVLQDIPYAPHKRQRLDLYARAEAAGLPVLIYVPGGGFVGGEKWSEDGFYSNIGCHFAERGFVVLIMNYRLAPDHPWPAGGEDVGYAVAWAREQAAAHGGDSSRIALFGQSAGASHVMTWLFDPVLKGAKPVSAVVLSSGTYRVVEGRIRPNVVAYFGSDASQYRVRSPMTHVRRTGVPFLLTVSEFDPAFMASPTFELAARLTNENGRPPQLRWLAGHNHVSNALSIGTPDGEAANVVLDFLMCSLS